MSQKLFIFLCLGVCVLTAPVFSKGPRTPRWPLPKASRELSSSSLFRISDYQSYLKSLSEKELAEFAEDAQIKMGSLGVNPERILVKFKDPETELRVLQSLRFKKPLREFKKLNAKLLRIPAGANQRELLAHLGALKELSGVEYAFPDYKIKVASQPNDPEFYRQWGFENLGSSETFPGALPDADIDAPEAWKVHTGSRTVVVGVLDTGIDYTHDDLAANIWKNPGETGTDGAGNDKSTNGIDDDANGFIDDFRGWDFVSNDNDPLDEMGHGTHVAGIIGASGNNELGVSGVNWQVSLVPLKVLDDAGYGELSAAMAALEYATQMGFPITNNSWGGGEYSEAFEELLKANRDAGSLFIAAAGNFASNNDLTPFYPANYQVENVISVAATDYKDRLGEFSNYGAQSVHLAAPGVDIFSTYPYHAYIFFSGTSMASPQVAGAAALIKAIWPELTSQQIKNKILQSVDEIIHPDFFGKTITGGRLNLARAVGGVPSPLPLRLALQSSEPKVGPPIGGTRLTLRGTGFHPNIQVTLGTKTCHSVQVTSQLELTCITSPSSVSALHSIKVTNPDNTTASLNGAFRYQSPPIVSSLNPLAGPIAGQNKLTLLGNFFRVGTKVKIGAKECQSVEVPSATQLTCALPANEAGSYQVVVTNPFGQESSEILHYTYQHAPRILSVSPSSGPLTGGNTLTVTGEGFLPGAQVQLQGIECPNPVRISETQITCTPQARSAGTYTVEVINTDTQRSVLESAYTYESALTISSVTPTVGPLAGGNLLTIQGAGFVVGATIRIQGIECRNPIRLSETQMTCLPRARRAGTYSIQVINPDSQQAQLPTAYTYQAAPILSGVNPKTGPSTGGNTINLQGRGFLAGARILLGEVECPNAVRVSATQMSCNPGPRVEGTYTIEVINPDEQKAALPQAYTYQATPSISSVNPSSGPLAGGNKITVTGSGFLPGARIRIQGVECLNNVRISGNQLQCNPRARGAGTYSIEVSNSYGQQVVLPQAYTYQPAPNISSVIPSSGPATGGNSLSIRGSGFLLGSRVQIGDMECPNTSRVSSDELTCKPLPRSPNTYSITVTNPDSQRAILREAYTYQAAPTITSVNPTFGPLSGGNTLTVNGTGFLPGAQIELAGVVCLNTAVVSESEMTCVPQARTSGTFSLSVINPDTQRAELSSAYTYLLRPNISAISPSFGPLAGGNRLTISGSDFLPDAEVFIGGVSCLNVLQVSATQLVCTPEARSAGTYPIRVVNPDGQQAALPQAYTYQPAPSITFISPTMRPLAGSTLLNIYGSDFLQGAKVRIQNIDCPNSVRVSGTQITCNPGTREAGTFSIEVINLDGQSGSLTDSFTYQPAPRISSVSPTSGPTTGGNTLSVNGDHFLPGARIQIQGIDCPNVVTVSPTQMTCTLTSRAAGTYHVRVLNPDGQQGLSRSAYTYKNTNASKR